MSDLNQVLQNLNPEDLPTTVDLTEMAEAPGGAWPKGWYRGEIIEGYTAGNYQFTTEDKVSQKGDSRNLRICLRVTNPSGEQRTTFTSYNYRITDFTAARIEAVKTARKEFAGQRGKWQGMEDLQRSSLALGGLGQLQKATGVPLSFNPDTHGIIVGPFVGAKPDVRLGINEETGYNEVTGLSPEGTAGKKQTAAKA